MTEKIQEPGKEYFDCVQGTAEGLKSIFSKQFIFMDFGAPCRKKNAKSGIYNPFKSLVYRTFIICQ